MSEQLNLFSPQQLEPQKTLRDILYPSFWIRLWSDNSVTANYITITTTADTTTADEGSQIYYYPTYSDRLTVYCQRQYSDRWINCSVSVSSVSNTVSRSDTDNSVPDTLAADRRDTDQRRDE